jgi:hypothetical protein
VAAPNKSPSAATLAKWAVLFGLQARAYCDGPGNFRAGAGFSHVFQLQFEALGALCGEQAYSLRVLPRLAGSLHLRGRLILFCLSAHVLLRRVTQALWRRAPLRDTGNPYPGHVGKNQRRELPGLSR